MLFNGKLNLKAWHVFILRFVLTREKGDFTHRKMHFIWQHLTDTWHAYFFFLCVCTHAAKSADLSKCKNPCLLIRLQKKSWIFVNYAHKQWKFKGKKSYFWVRVALLLYCSCSLCLSLSEPVHSFSFSHGLVRLEFSFVNGSWSRTSSTPQIIAFSSVEQH